MYLFEEVWVVHCGQCLGAHPSSKGTWLCVKKVEGVLCRRFDNVLVVKIYKFMCRGCCLRRVACLSVI